MTTKDTRHFGSFVVESCLSQSLSPNSYVYTPRLLHVCALMRFRWPGSYMQMSTNAPVCHRYRNFLF